MHDHGSGSAITGRHFIGYETTIYPEGTLDVVMFTDSQPRRIESERGKHMPHQVNLEQAHI